MIKIKCLIMVLFLCFITTLAWGQTELPEPTSSGITYVGEIFWGTSNPNAEWTRVVITSVSSATGTLGQHIYYGSIGQQTWQIPDIEDSSKIVTITFNINSLPNNAIWGYYRFRLQALSTPTAIPDPNMWSPIGFWVRLINIRRLLQPLHINN